MRNFNVSLPKYILKLQKPSKKSVINVRTLLKVFLEIICSQRHLSAISVLHISHKAIPFVPGFISAFSYFHPLAHCGLCVGGPNKL